MDEPRRWTVDDALADPLGYQRQLDAEREAEAEAWDERQMHELAQTRRGASTDATRPER